MSLNLPFSKTSLLLSSQAEIVSLISTKFQQKVISSIKLTFDTFVTLSKSKRACTIKVFTAVIVAYLNKLECLPLPITSTLA